MLVYIFLRQYKAGILNPTVAVLEFTISTFQNAIKSAILEC